MFKTCRRDGRDAQFVQVEGSEKCISEVGLLRCQEDELKLGWRKW